MVTLKVKLATAVEGNSKSPFSIPITPRCREGCSLIFLFLNVFWEHGTKVYGQNLLHSKWSCFEDVPYIYIYIYIYIYLCQIEVSSFVVSFHIRSLYSIESQNRVYFGLWLILGRCIVFLCLYGLVNKFLMILLSMLMNLWFEMMRCLIFSIFFVPRSFEYDFFLFGGRFEFGWGNLIFFVFLGFSVFASVFGFEFGR